MPKIADVLTRYGLDSTPDYVWHDLLLELIEAYLEDNDELDYVTVQHIAISIGIDARPTQLGRIGKILVSEYGWKRVRITLEGARVWVYYTQ